MKLAVTALVLLFPLLAQGQQLEPPYQLDPGESPPATVPPPPTTPPPTTATGSFPALTTNWGHRHPDCPSAASIESTMCSPSGTIPGGKTLQNCTLNGSVRFAGDNITLSCVKWDVPSDNANSGVFCADSGGCRNINIVRTTMTGNEVPSGGPGNGMTFLNLSSGTFSNAYNTMRVEKSVIKGNRVGVILGGGTFDKDGASIEPGYAFVLRESILRQPQYRSADHSELVALVETTDGALFENNLFYCQDGMTCNTGNFLGQPHNGGTIQNISIIGNRIVSDSTGFAMTFDQDKSKPGNCVTRVRFENNVIESNGSGVWNYGTCPSIQNRTGSTCTGNKVNGSPAGC
ncbi:hypothetical protein KJ059_02675 [Myxococcota bacterium]|nr:hypothetical protein [Myxococcota bacterium]